MSDGRTNECLQGPAFSTFKKGSCSGFAAIGVARGTRHETVPMFGDGNLAESTPAIWNHHNPSVQAATRSISRSVFAALKSPGCQNWTFTRPDLASERRISRGRSCHAIKGLAGLRQFGEQMKGTQDFMRPDQESESENVLREP